MVQQGRLLSRRWGHVFDVNPLVGGRYSCGTLVMTGDGIFKMVAGIVEMALPQVRRFVKYVQVLGQAGCPNSMDNTLLSAPFQHGNVPIGPGSDLSVLFVGSGKWVGVVRSSGMDNLLLSAPFQDGYGQYPSFGSIPGWKLADWDLVAT
jgi:hypothetical protein